MTEDEMDEEVKAQLLALVKHNLDAPGALREADDARMKLAIAAEDERAAKHRELYQADIEMRERHLMAVQKISEETNAILREIRDLIAEYTA
jgi:hypothetical protein